MIFQPFAPIDHSFSSKQLETLALRWQATWTFVVPLKEYRNLVERKIHYRDLRVDIKSSKSLTFRLQFFFDCFLSFFFWKFYLSWVYLLTLSLFSSYLVSFSIIHIACLPPNTNKDRDWIFCDLKSIFHILIMYASWFVLRLFIWNPFQIWVMTQHLPS